MPANNKRAVPARASELAQSGTINQTGWTMLKQSI